MNENTSPNRRLVVPKVAIAAGVTAAVALAGAGVAVAVSGHSSTAHLAATSSTSGSGSSSGSSSSAGSTPNSGSGNGPSSRPAPHVGAGRGLGMGRAGLGFGGLGGPGAHLIHGQGVIKVGSAYKTYDVQTGTVQTVSSDAITVLSPDGFSATYVVDPTTVVDAQAGGISTVTHGDTVSVMALVSGKTATATSILDQTKIASSRKSFGWGGPPGVQPGANPGTAPASTPQ